MPLKRLAETLDAPVVLTVNARGLLYAPSARRAGQPEPQGGARADGRRRPGDRRRHRIRPDRLRHVCRRRLRPAGKSRPHRHRRRAACAPARDRFDRGRLRGRAGSAACRLRQASRCNRTAVGWREARRRPREAPRATNSARRCRRSSTAVETIRDTLPGSIIVGDSTQPIYAANLYYDHDRPGGWFNAATGFGALGYGPPAAIGAALAVPDAPVVCLTGDGGFQFTLPELAAAVEAGRAGHLRRLEQSRLPRDRDLDARCRRRAGRRVAGAAGFLQDRRSLRHCGERLASPAGLATQPCCARGRCERPYLIEIAVD